MAVVKNKEGKKRKEYICTLGVEYQLQNKKSIEIYNIKRKRKSQGTNTKHQAGLVLCIKVARNSLKTNQPGKKKREKNNFHLRKKTHVSCFMPPH